MSQRITILVPKSNGIAIDSRLLITGEGNQIGHPASGVRPLRLLAYAQSMEEA